jgi:tetratricopeptide (TPR) repeat protein
MKNTVIAALITLICASKAIASAESADSLVKKAQLCYSEQDYDCAAQAWEAVVVQGARCPVLFYNLGNAYFKKGEIAKSILYYEKALLRKPNCPDTKENLAIANTYQIDKINAIPEFVVGRIYRSAASQLSATAWAVISAILFAALFASAALYLLASSVAGKKAGFFGAAGLLGFFFLAVSFAHVRKQQIQNSGFAIVMAASVKLRSAPDASGTELVIVHEGLKIKHYETVGQWIKAKLPDGSVGWVRIEDIEKI